MEHIIPQNTTRILGPCEGAFSAINYRKIGNLGKGSFGEVVHAVNIHTGKSFAIKRIPASDDPLKDRIALEREVEVLKTGMHSAFIVQFHEAFVLAKDMWIVMEFCEAGSLDQLLRDRGTGRSHPLSEGEAACIIKMLLLGLTHLHQYHKMHRDVKAANVLVTGKGECKLADFGLSALLESTGALAQTRCGTPQFLSPEFCNGGKYSNKVDIWALGVLLYELLTGRIPNVLRTSTDAPSIMRAIAMFGPKPESWSLPSKPDNIARFTPSLESRWGKTLASGNGWSDELRDFMQCCFEPCPDKRWGAAQLLAHAWICRVPRMSCEKTENGYAVKRMHCPPAPEGMGPYPCWKDSPPSKETAKWALKHDDMGYAARGIVKLIVKHAVDLSCIHGEKTPKAGPRVVSLDKAVLGSAATLEANKNLSTEEVGKKLEAVFQSSETKARVRAEKIDRSAENQMHEAEQAEIAAAALATAKNLQVIRMTPQKRVGSGSIPSAEVRKAARWAAMRANMAAEKERRERRMSTPPRPVTPAKANADGNEGVSLGAGAAGMGFLAGMSAPSTELEAPSSLSGSIPSEAPSPARYLRSESSCPSTPMKSGSSSGDLSSIGSLGSFNSISSISSLSSTDSDLNGTLGNSGTLGNDTDDDAWKNDVDDGSYTPKALWIAKEFLQTQSVLDHSNNVFAMEEQAKDVAEHSREIVEKLQSTGPVSEEEIDDMFARSSIWSLAADHATTLVSHAAALACLASAVLRSSSALTINHIEAAIDGKVSPALQAMPVCGSMAQSIKEAAAALRVNQKGLQSKSIACIIEFAIYEGQTSATVKGWLKNKGLLFLDKWVHPFAPGMVFNVPTATGVNLSRCASVDVFIQALKKRENKAQIITESYATAASLTERFKSLDLSSYREPVDDNMALDIFFSAAGGELDVVQSSSDSPASEKMSSTEALFEGFL